jgi:ClpP class serine protease
VAVVPIVGVIEHRRGILSELLGVGVSTSEVRTAIRALAAEPDTNTIVLVIDSPGGEVDGVTELAATIRDVRRTRRVVAIADTMAASAAYWIGAQASEFVATPSAQLGSIGVYGAHEDVSGLEAKLGGQRDADFGRPLQGRNLEPWLDLRPGAGDPQGQVDAIYQTLVDDIAFGRHVSPGTVARRFGEGRTLLANPALAAGMVDRIGTLEDVIAEASDRAAAFRSEMDRRRRIAASRLG